MMYMIHYEVAIDYRCILKVLLTFKMLCIHVKPEALREIMAPHPSFSVG